MRTVNLKKPAVLLMVLWLSLGNVASASLQNGNKESIRIGVFLGLTGPFSQFAQATFNGAQLATAEINQAGGVEGRRIELIVRDDLGRPDEAANVVSKLIEKDRVHALLGDVSSANSLAAAPIAQHATVPMITPSGTHLSITRVGDYIFRAAFADDFQGAALAEFAVRTLKARRVAILRDNSSAYSQMLAEVVQVRLARLGSQVVNIQGYEHGDRDFTAQLVSIKASRPDLLFVPGYYTEAGMIVKQAKQVGFSKPLLGGDGWASRQLWTIGGFALNGSYILDHYASDNPAPENKKFVVSYQARYGGLTPDALAALGYDAVKILVDAIRRAGGTEGSALRSALAETTNFPGVTGPITFDENRNVIKPAVILKLQNGRFVYFQSVRPGDATAAIPAPDKTPAKHRTRRSRHRRGQRH